MTQDTATETSSSPDEPQYIPTKRIFDAIRALKSYQDDLNPTELIQFRELQSYLTTSALEYATSSLSSLAPTLPDPITHTHITYLSTLYRAYVYDVDDAEQQHTGTIEELIQGAQRYVPVKRKRSPSFEAYLERMRIKQHQREYTELVKDLPGNKSLQDREKSMASSYATVSKDIGIGVHVLALMATGFIVFWYVGRQMWVGNQVWPVVCGLIGMILAMFLEIILFLLRDSRVEHRAATIKARRDAEAKAALANQRVVEKKMEAYAQKVAQRGKNKGKGKKKQEVEDSDDE